MRVLLTTITALMLCLGAADVDAPLNVRSFGAIPDGKTLCTAAIQKAIDSTSSRGGGTILFPAGRYLSGTIRLKSNVTIHLDAGAVLLGSTNIKDYPDHIPAIRSYTDNYVKQSLILAEDAENIAIEGRGTIDGQGAAFVMNRQKPYENRPYIIRVINCRNVLVEGISMRASPMWMQHYLACEKVTIRGINVFNHVNANNDGLDIDACRDVTISDCTFDSDDDAITLKSTLDRPCENITITNCISRSHCNAIKMGTESNGGFINIAISNCVVTSPPNTRRIYGEDRGMSALALEVVDGGRMERVTISNISITGVSVPIFLRLGNRARPFSKDSPAPGMGSMRDVMISNIIAGGTGKTGCSITGLPGHPIENVTLSNIRLGFDGGGEKSLASRTVEEFPTRYPESLMFGDLPAYGIFVRHVKGLTLRDISLRTEKPDRRHAVVFDDVEDATIDALSAAWSGGASALLRLSDAKDVLLRNCRPPAGSTFLSVEGKDTRGVSLIGNDVSRAGRAIDVASDVPRDAVRSNDRQERN